jgi:SOUL heme-binding protein
MRPLLLGLALIAIPMLARSIEEPDDEVWRKIGAIEVRQCTPYLVAEELVADPGAKAGNQALSILAGYIFGKSKGERKFAMTSRVTQAAAPVKLEMTATVTQSAAAGGDVVQFVLPRGVTLASAPEPLDPQVRLREVPGGKVAAITFSGFWSQANCDDHLAELTAAPRGADLAWSGETVCSRDNAPFTPWFMRRNEIWLSLP